MIELENKLKVEMNEILSILFSAQESFKIYDLLTRKHKNEEENYIIHMSSFFRFCAQNQLDLIILSLTKLYHSTESYNIRKFINKFRVNKEFQDINIPITKVNLWQNSISNQKDKIEAVVRYRHKNVAHNSVEKYDSLNLSKGCLRKLIQTAQVIFKEIYMEVWKQDFQIERPINEPIGNLKYIVRELAQKKMEIEPIVILEIDYDLI